jgi:hypothetical protein
MENSRHGSIFSAPAKNNTRFFSALPLGSFSLPKRNPFKRKFIFKEGRRN